MVIISRIKTGRIKIIKPIFILKAKLFNQYFPTKYIHGNSIMAAVNINQIKSFTNNKSISLIVAPRIFLMAISFVLPEIRYVVNPNPKIDKVKELLIYDELNLIKIAYRMHYSGVAHLSNQFKKMTGMTLSQFKNLKNRARNTLSDI